MSRIISAIFLLVPTFLFIAATAAYSADMQVELSATELFPGDAFRIKITGGPQATEVGMTVLGIQTPLSRCGKDCLAGIGVIPPGTEPGNIIITIRSGIIISEVCVSVMKPEYPERHISLPEGMVELSAGDIERAGNEAKKLGAIWPVRSEKLYHDTFVMPLPNPIITVYGAKRIFNMKKTSVHRGIDIMGKSGEEVKASNRGRVVLAEELFFGGNTIIVDHGLGIYSIYMHLAGLTIKPGIIVEKGQVIGVVGSTGRSTAPHLHLGFRILNFNANPASIIAI